MLQATEVPTMREEEGHNSAYSSNPGTRRARPHRRELTLRAALLLERDALFQAWRRLPRRARIRLGAATTLPSANGSAGIRAREARVVRFPLRRLLLRQRDRLRLLAEGG